MVRKSGGLFAAVDRLSRQVACGRNEVIKDWSEHRIVSGGGGKGGGGVDVIDIDALHISGVLVLMDSQMVLMR